MMKVNEMPGLCEHSHPHPMGRNLEDYNCGINMQLQKYREYLVKYGMCNENNIDFYECGIHDQCILVMRYGQPWWHNDWSWVEYAPPFQVA